MYGVLWPQPPVPGECHGGRTLHWGHQAHFPLYGVSCSPHETAAGAHLAAGCRGGSAACATVEALQGSELQELVFLSHEGTQRLAGCALASALLCAGPTGSAALYCMQYSYELCFAAVQIAPQASLQRDILPHRDDLPAPGHHVGVMCVLGPFTGNKSLFHFKTRLITVAQRELAQVKDETAQGFLVFLFATKRFHLG